MSKKAYSITVLLVLVSLLLAACSAQATPTPPVQTTVAPTSITASTTSTVPSVTKPVATPTSTTPAPVSSPVVSATPKPPASTPVGQQQYGGILRFIVTGSPLILGDPSLIVDGGNYVIPCLQALVFSENSGELKGVLATGWTVSQDGKSITFNLRKGVKFHDGTDFNAQAAKWNLDRYMKAYATSTASLWTGIDVVDDYTVRLNLKSFQNTILNALEGTASLMISPSAAEKNGLEWLKLNPVGTGPYKFKKLFPGCYDRIHPF